jgi:hypothetical protein
LATDRKSAFSGLEKVAAKRLEVLGGAQVDALLKGGNLGEVPALVSRLADGGKLSAGWVASQFAALSKTADIATRLKASKIPRAEGAAPFSVPDDLEKLRELDAKWRAIAGNEAAATLGGANPKVSSSMEKAVSTVDGALGNAASRFLTALLAADRFVEAEELVEADASRTPSGWKAKALEAIAKRRATTTMGVDTCLQVPYFDTCRAVVDSLTATCQALEPLRASNERDQLAFLAAARDAELERRVSSPTAPEAFTCNTTARQKLAEVLPKTWKDVDDATLEATVNALKVPDGKCESKNSAGWWDGRYCEGIAALSRAANAARTIVRAHASTEIATNAKNESYSDARSVKSRWTPLLGEKWATEMERKIQSINDANDAAERAREAAAEAAARARAAACYGSCMSLVVSCDSGSDFAPCSPLFGQCCNPAPNDCKYRCGMD